MSVLLLELLLELLDLWICPPIVSLPILLLIQGKGVNAHVHTATLSHQCRQVLAVQSAVQLGVHNRQRVEKVQVWEPHTCGRGYGECFNVEVEVSSDIHGFSHLGRNTNNIVAGGIRVRKVMVSPSVVSTFEFTDGRIIPPIYSHAQNMRRRCIYIIGAACGPAHSKTTSTGRLGDSITLTFSTCAFTE